MTSYGSGSLTESDKFPRLGNGGFYIYKTVGCEFH